MQMSRFPSGSVIGIVLVVCVLIVGCQQQPAAVAKDAKRVCSGDQSDCKKKDIYMDITNGVDKQDVCVCKGDKVEWHETDNNNQKHQFRVEFKNGSPFSGQTVFDNNSGQSNGADDFPAGTKFKYEITVDGKWHDPRIVGGGGHPIQ